MIHKARIALLRTSASGSVIANVSSAVAACLSDAYPMICAASAR
jgi:hypothetical protein